MEKFWRIFTGLFIIVGLTVFGILGLYDIIAYPYRDGNVLTLIALIVIVLIGIWFFIKGIINAYPRRTQTWSFYTFREKYNTMRICSNYCGLNTIIFSGALLRNDVVVDISEFHFLTKSDLFEDGNNLIIVRETNGKYYMKYKK